MKKLIGILAAAVMAITFAYAPAAAATNPFSLGVIHNLTSGAKTYSQVAVSYRLTHILSNTFALNAEVANFNGKLRYGANVSKVIFGNTSLGVSGLYNPTTKHVVPGLILSVPF